MKEGNQVKFIKTERVNLFSRMAQMTNFLCKEDSADTIVENFQFALVSCNITNTKSSLA